jgi:hypothetical protein
MMTTTHALAGALVGATTALYAPELTPTAVAAGFVGGALPDADLVGIHRRSTHFPVWGAAAALVVVGLAALLGTSGAVLAAVVAVAAALHPLMDVFGGGVGHRPWEATSDRGVYTHAGGYWVRPRRWIRYAGAPEDVGLAAGVAVPLLVVTAGHLRDALLAALLLSGLFALVRRRLAAITERLFGEDLTGS